MVEDTGDPRIKVKVGIPSEDPRIKVKVGISSEAESKRDSASRPGSQTNR